MNIIDYNKDDVLDDGRPVVVRALRPDDKSALREGFARLSTKSTYARFFQAKRSLSNRELKYLTELDFTRHVAIGIGLLQDDQVYPIGVARYVVNDKDPQSAEVAFTVDDAYQGVGAGTILLKHLAKIARANGIETFYATVMASNKRMMHVFQRSNRPMRRSMKAGVIEVTLKLE